MNELDKHLINQMSYEQKLALIYDKRSEGFNEECRYYGADFIDGLIEHNTINDPAKGVSHREPVMGMLLALANLYESGAGAQSRLELQAQTELSQFAVSITSAISDRAAVIRSAVDDCLVLESAYASVILGRRELDVEFVDSSGTCISYESGESEEQLELFGDE